MRLLGLTLALGGCFDRDGRAWGGADTGKGRDTATPGSDSGAADTDAKDTNTHQATCDPAWGDLSATPTFDGYVMTEAPAWTTVWALVRTGAVCAAECTDAWASAFLCDPHATTMEPVALPALVTDEADRAICVFLDPPDGASGTCVVTTSSGAWTLAYTLNP